tara:strand:+ start:222 stop:671 length:450 start_codon:yes stop_codon:yes gene_type:complete
MKAISLAESLVLKSEPEKRKKYSRIDYKDADGADTTKGALAKYYGVGEQGITRAFSAHSGCYKKANAHLHERHIVPMIERKPETYIRRDYRDLDGNPISRKECAEIMGLDPHYLGKLYEKHENNWRFIYDNFGKTKIANLAERKAKALA